MSEFVYMESWDLQAVVRGCTNESSANIMDSTPSFFDPLSFEQDHDFLLSFPEIFETTTVFDELEDLYKPFYPETIVSSSISVQEEVKEPKKKQKKQQQPPAQSDIAASSNGTTPRVVKSKRRKNQNKMVVQQVTAEGLSLDKWAWRKYGQKPIKGSPYPRSYYRCSSSKGCLARKQVERNPSDPKNFIVTYTAEHSHTQPLRRNSLAGITRNKSSTPKFAATDNLQMTTEPILSPTTASIIDDFAQREKIKKEEEQMLEDDDQSNENVMPGIIFSDELFPSLEDMETLFLYQS